MSAAASREAREALEAEQKAQERADWQEFAVIAELWPGDHDREPEAGQ